MFGKIRIFYELKNSHKLVFIKIALLVPLVELGIKTIKFKQTVNVLEFFLKESVNAPENEPKIVQRYVNYLNLFHKQMPSIGKCLARSLTLWFLLQRKGIKTELKFGMKKENRKLLAHSWLEFKGKALVTQAEIEKKYIPFAESIMTKINRVKKI